MHGVPPNLELERFHGATLTQIAIGEFQIQFILTEPEVLISIEGDWLITNAEGETVDRSLPNQERDAFRVHRLLGRTITATRVEAPRSFSLRFDNGWILTVLDSSEAFESFSIQPGDIFV